VNKNDEDHKSTAVGNKKKGVSTLRWIGYRKDGKKSRHEKTSGGKATLAVGQGSFGGGRM
jgi:hypothetical protein